MDYNNLDLVEVVERLRIFFFFVLVSSSANNFFDEHRTCLAPNVGQLPVIPLSIW